MTGRGEKLGGVEDFGDAVLELEAMESGVSDYDSVGVGLIEFAEAGMDIAAYGAELEIGAEMQ